MTTSMSPTQTRRRPESINTVATLKTGSTTTADNYCKIENAGIGPLRQIVITLTACPVTVADNGANGGAGSIQLLDFPAGLLYTFGGVCSLTATSGSLTDANLIVSVGSTAAASDNGTLTTTEANFIPSTGMALTSGSTTSAAAGKSTSAGGFIDGTSTAVDAYLNVATSTNPSAEFTVYVTGTITLTYIMCGDC